MNIQYQNKPQQSDAYDPTMWNSQDANEVKAAVNSKADLEDLALKADKSELAAKANTSALANKQDTLVSGTNIKTINGTSLLGTGDIVIAAGTSGATDAQLRDRSTHTGTQSASTIVEDSTHRFTNDTDKAKLNALSNFKPADYAKDAFFEKANGIYIPLLTPGSFDNPTANADNGLALHPSGGVRASVAGTTGSGNIYLPQAIDPTKPFRFAVLVEINDTQPIEAINFMHADNDWRSGLQAVNISTTGITLNVAGETNMNDFGNPNGGGTGVPVGTRIWITLASDGVNGVTAAIFPDNNPITGMLIGSQTYAPPYDGIIRGINLPTDYQNTGSGINAWGGTGAQLKNRLVKIQVSTKSTASRVIGLWANQNLGGPSDGRLTPPAILKTNIYNDQTGYVIIPKKQGTAPIDLVMINHPNAYGTWDQYRGDSVIARSSLVLGKLIDAGYCVFGLDGGYGGQSNTFQEATISNWGAPTGMRYRKGIWDFVRNNVPGTRYIYAMGLSMGFLNSLRLSIQYPNQIRGIVGIGGVCDLKDCYDNRGFASIINKAYATWYVSLKAALNINPLVTASITAAKATGVTTLNVAALPYSIPSGTSLSLVSGTGQAVVVTSAAAAANATTISVTALTTAISNGAKYDVSSYFTQITYGFSQPEEVYYKSPYIWRDMYTAGVSYAANTVIGIPAQNASAKTFQFVDPNLNPNQFTKIPIKIWHGIDDTLIPIAQAQGLTTSINAAGGNVSLVTVAGGTHLGDSTFDGDGIVAFFNSLSN
jgi:pimeloyl-ACP methyl ester carboxylesterase